MNSVYSYVSTGTESSRSWPCFWR